MRTIIELAVLLIVSSSVGSLIADAICGALDRRLGRDDDADSD